MCNHCMSRRALLIGLISIASLTPLQDLCAQGTPDGGPQIKEQFVPGLRNQTGFFGLATIDAAGPVIYYEPGLAPDLFRFVRAHEYGHHRRGHVGAFIQNAGNPYAMPWINFHAELDADCYAASVLRRQNDIAAIQAGMQAYQRLLFPHSFPGMPGSQQRLANIQACAR
jgi:hypothetical protein